MSYVSTLLAFIIANLFFLTAFDKIIHWKEHLISVREYQIIKSSLASTALTLFIISELFVSLSIFIYGIMTLNFILCILLLVLYSVAILINLRRGYKNISCGCGSVLKNDELNISIVIRNIILIAICFFMYYIHYLGFNEISIFNKIILFLIAFCLLLHYGLIQRVIGNIKILNNVLNKYF